MTGDIAMETGAKPYLTPSDVLEYLFCPRFIYFERVLKIPEHQEKRFKVQKGREAHESRSRANRAYLRQKLGVVDKRIDVPMASEELKMRGQVDEVLFFEDGTAGPLDYKWAKWGGRVFQNQRAQSIIYGMLIAATFSVPVERGYLCYVRGGQHIEELRYCSADFNWVGEIIQSLLDVIQYEHYPKATSSKRRCPDCCYRNICV